MSWFTKHSKYEQIIVSNSLDMFYLFIVMPPVNTSLFPFFYINCLFSLYYFYNCVKHLHIFKENIQIIEIFNIFNHFRQCQHVFNMIKFKFIYLFAMYHTVVTLKSEIISLL